MPVTAISSAMTKNTLTTTSMVSIWTALLSRNSAWLLTSSWG